MGDKMSYFYLFIQASRPVSHYYGDVSVDFVVPY